ncbi:Serine/threonine-protein kinase ulk2 [Ceratobasidium sp. 423]|nr:Serine/threonine-protein kinase ulk2 [Ceratobasidium sp. 423]
MHGMSTDEVHPYVVADEIGRGGFSTVYSGYQKETHRAVAIKTVSRSILTLKLMDRLEAEVNILKTLKHRHIVELTDLVISTKHVYLIMEFCPGGDLLSYLKHRGRIPSLHTAASPHHSYLSHPKLGGLADPVVRSFTGQLASAVRFLRDRDLIHRDIKPQNLLLSPASSADEYTCNGAGGWIPGPVGTPILKIGDFGLVKVLPSASLADTVCGSPWVTSPSHLRY